MYVTKEELAELRRSFEEAKAAVKPSEKAGEGEYITKEEFARLKQALAGSGVMKAVEAEKAEKGYVTKGEFFTQLKRAVAEILKPAEKAEEEKVEEEAKAEAEEEYVTKEEFAELKQALGEMEVLKPVTKKVEEVEEKKYITREEFARLERALEEGEAPKPAEKVEEKAREEKVEVRVEEEEGDYVTRDDFDEFKGSIIQLQKTFINFFTTYGLELGGKPSTEEQKHFKDEVKNLLEME